MEDNNIENLSFDEVKSLFEWINVFLDWLKEYSNIHKNIINELIILHGNRKLLNDSKWRK